MLKLNRCGSGLEYPQHLHNTNFKRSSQKGILKRILSVGIFSNF